MSGPIEQICESCTHSHWCGGRLVCSCPDYQHVSPPIDCVLVNECVKFERYAGAE